MSMQGPGEQSAASEFPMHLDFSDLVAQDHLSEEPCQEFGTSWAHSSLISSPWRSSTLWILFIADNMTAIALPHGC